MTRKMNIAFLTKDYDLETVDAGFTSLVNLAKELKRLGHTVVFIQNKGYASWYTPAANKAYEEVKGVPVYRPYGVKWFNIRWMHMNPTIIFNRFIAPGIGVRYVQKKLGIQFDVLHGSSSSPLFFISVIIGKLFARKARLFHTIRSETTFDKLGYRSARLLNLASAVFVPLESLRKKLIDHGCMPNKVKLVRSSIVLKNFSQFRESPEKLRKKWGVKLDETVVLYYGKGGPLKGVDVFLEAINFIPEKEKVKFLLFHPVVWLPHLIRLVEEHKYKKKISLNVKKIYVPDYLHLADIQVLPLKSVQGTEGNPLCLLEGMAAKTPIVTTDLDDLKEVVRPEKDVLMAKPGDSKSLARAIMRLVRDKKLRVRLAESAYEVVQDFDISVTAKKYLEVYIN